MEQVAEVMRELAVMVHRKERLTREIDETDSHIVRLRGTLHRDFPELIDAIFPQRGGRVAAIPALIAGRITVASYAERLGVPSRQVYHAISDGWLHAPAVDEHNTIDPDLADAMLATVPRDPPRRIVAAARALLASRAGPLAPSEASVLIASRVDQDGTVEVKAVRPDPNGAGASVSFDTPVKRSVLVAPPIEPAVTDVVIHGVDPGGPDQHVEGPAKLAAETATSMSEAMERAQRVKAAAPKIERMDQPAADPPEPEAAWDAPMAPEDERPEPAQAPAPEPRKNGHDTAAAPTTPRPGLAGTGPQPGFGRITVGDAVRHLRRMGCEVVPQKGDKYRVDRAMISEDELLDRAAESIARQDRLAQAKRGRAGHA